MVTPTLEQQIATLDKARERILAAPDSLYMDTWHSICGTTRCLAGFIELDYVQDRTIKSKLSTLEITELLIPNFKKFLFGSTAKTLIWIRTRGYALARGEVTKDAESNLWVDSGINFYSDKFSKAEAKTMSASNLNCSYCTDCSECLNCSGCTNCVNCNFCKNCSYCNDCSFAVNRLT